MGYMHIENLYKNTSIFEFRRCIAMEKVHGTSAHLRWDGSVLHYSPGGESINNFKALFNHASLIDSFKKLGSNNVIVYGEAYGGKQQGMSDVYGNKLQFIVFDVKIDDIFQDVFRAEEITKLLMLEFVPYEVGPAELDWVNQQRDSDSVVAVRRGMGSGKEREGVVLRPLFEVLTGDGERIITKHKRDKFRETATIREVDPEKIQLLEDANKISEEWVTDMRLTHVLDKLPKPHDFTISSALINAMIEDVLRESKGEIVDSKEARKAIGKRTILLFKKYLSKF